MNPYPPYGPPSGQTPYPPLGFAEMPQPTFVQPGGPPGPYPPSRGGGYYPPEPSAYIPPPSGPYPPSAPSAYIPPPSGPYPPSGGGGYYPPGPGGGGGYYPPGPGGGGGGIGGGFPIAPSGSGYPPGGYPPQSGSYPSGPSYPPSQPSYPPPPSQPSYPPLTGPSSYPAPSYPPPGGESYPSSSSNSHLYPNLGGLSNTSNNFNQYPGPSYPGGGMLPPQQPIGNPVIRPYHPFNANEDAGRLYKAMKGLGTDEATLIDVLCHRTWRQREEITVAYKASYGKDLLRNIQSETSGDFCDVLLALLKRPMVLEAENLRHAIAGFGTNEDLLIDIICTKSNAEMIELKNIYRQMFSRNLEEDVKDDVSGYFKRFLVSLMAANRNENQPPDYNRAAQQARELYGAGERRLGTDEVTFNRIFATESYAQLRLIFDEYQKLTRHPIENAVRSEMSTSVEKAYLTLINYARSPAGFYAQRLNDSMRGMGTRDRMLIRICVLRSEIDMQDIKMEFQRRFGRPLEAWIRSDCSGDYRRTLLCLVGDPRWK